VRVPQPARRPAGGEGVLGLVDQDREGRLEQRDVDALPDPLGRGSGAFPASAASTATAPSSPVTTSLMATPTLVGEPPSASGAPVTDISPPSAWITKS
jgi:hypothetical protein